MDRREILKGAGTLVATLTGIGGASTAASQQGQASVLIVGTNEPVSGGEWLSVYAHITNHGFGPLRANAELIVGRDPETVDSRFLSLSPNETRRIELGYSTYPVQTTDVFPVRVRCAGGFDSRTVRVDPAP